MDYFPLRATQTFDTRTMAITNGIYVGSFALVRFFGSFEWLEAPAVVRRAVLAVAAWPACACLCLSLRPEAPSRVLTAVLRALELLSGAWAARAPYRAALRPLGAAARSAWLLLRCVALNDSDTHSTRAWAHEHTHSTCAWALQEWCPVEVNLCIRLLARLHAVTYGYWDACMRLQDRRRVEFDFDRIAVLRLLAFDLPKVLLSRTPTIPATPIQAILAHICHACSANTCHACSANTCHTGFTDAVALPARRV